MIDAEMFSRPMFSPSPFNRVCHFGLADKSDAASALRRMADAVEQGLILVQRVQSGRVATLDEWLRDAIMIEWVQATLPETAESGSS